MDIGANQEAEMTGTYRHFYDIRGTYDDVCSLVEDAMLHNPWVVRDDRFIRDGFRMHRVYLSSDRDYESLSLMLDLDAGRQI
jgi:hypothetical protein